VVGLEALEDRTLMSVLPTPLTTGHVDVSLATSPGGSDESAPSVAYDPLNPQHLVSVWTAHSACGLSEIDMAFSTNGGQTWSPYQGPSNNNFTCNAGNPTTTSPLGPSEPDPTQIPPFEFADSATVAFDRAHVFYVTFAEYHQTNLAGRTKAGTVDLKKFDFSGGAPNPITFPTGGLTNVLYAWAGIGTDPGMDPALNPVVAVDNNLPDLLPDPSNPNAPPVAFVDPVTGATQSDPFANNHINPATGLPNPNFDQVYVAWNVHDVLPSIGFGLQQVGLPTDSTPDLIRMVASSDGGNNFTSPTPVNDGVPLTIDGSQKDGANYGNPEFANPDRNTNPVITISQGTSSERAATPPLTVKTLTSSGSTVTVVTVQPLPFWLETGSQVTIAGADQTQYDGTYIINVNPSIPNTFTYQLTSAGPGSASGTGSITALPIVNPGGQLNIAWSDFGNGQILSDRVLDGGSGINFAGPLNGVCMSTQVGSSICDPPSGVPSITTVYTLDLTNVVPPAGFTTISNLTVDLTLVHPHTSELEVDLVSPTGILVNLTAGTDYVGNIGIPDKGGFGLGAPFNTVFDDSAARFIDDGAPNKPTTFFPWASTFKPMNQIVTGKPDGLSAWDGLKLTDPKVAGKWLLEITDDKTDPGVQFLNDWDLRFSSELTTNSDRVAVKNSPTNPGPVIPGNPFLSATLAYPDRSVPAEPDRGVGPAPAIAVDNTLGSFSPFQGRLYVAYTSGTSTTDANPNVFLTTSDDGGLSWTQPVQVNDDSASDNFSGGNRAQFQPGVAVDPVTGTLVVSWYDARYDAANARVALFMTTSLDGGWKPDPSGNGLLVPDFAPATFLNAAQQAFDDASFDPTTGGHTLDTLQPIPDNQSAGNPNRDQTFAFGERQALTVYDGHVHALWSGNEDGGPRLSSLDVNGQLVSTDFLDILSSDTVIAAGPRITASTMGPVQDKSVTTDDGRTITFNNTYAPETSATAAGGTQQVDGFVVTFDRPVDVSSFTTDELTVLFRGTKTQANSTPPFFGGQVVDPTTYQITPLDGYTTRYGPAEVGGTTLDAVTGVVVPILATQFLVTFEPEDETGTYSYSVGPDIRDDVRQPNLTVVHGTPVSPPPPHSNPSGSPTDPAALPIPIDASSGDTGGPSSKDTVSTITLSGYDPKLQITHLDVKVRINHTQDSDLVIKLIGPDGVTAATLAMNNGTGMDFGTSSPNRNGATITSYTTFDDLATVSINFGSSPFSGSFAPETALSVFDGFGVNGAWKLDIRDTAQGDTGTLIDWTMDIQAGFPVQQTGLGNKMDQNGDAVTADTILPLGSADPADTYSDPRPLGGVPFELPYDPLTLPLSVPGPHIVSTFVPGLDAQGNPLNPPSKDNLVVNGTVHAIDVTFDRDMNPATFTTADLLGLLGPVGGINLFDAQGNPLPGVYVRPDPSPAYPRLINGVLTTAADPSAQFPRTFQIGLPSDPNDPAGVTGQELSGTYSLTLGSGIQSKIGEGLDTNLNAGFAVLDGVDPTSTNLVAGGVSHDTGTIAVTVKPGTTASASITFSEAFQIQHAQVLLNITSPDARDLTGFLVSPTGAKILLFSGAGGQPRPGLSGFVNTTLDDLGLATIQPDANGNGPAQPFPGTFSPAQPLGALDGTSSAGTWQLQITNNGPATHTATITEWRLTLSESQLGSGLGEPVADQAQVGFRVFTMDPSNPLSHQVWTATGPASETTSVNGQLIPISGQIGAMAVDPSDPSGNTVYVAGATGGIWKTTNFLTSDPKGPTYVPLTNFGPTFGINIGSIAVFGQNNDPRQSVIIAATGDGDFSSTGVGFLRSTDGGQTWTLLDSSVNVNAAGQPLAINDPARDHAFVNTTGFKVVVDPVRSPSGNIVIFAALEGVNGSSNGGIWRSLDGGNTWTNVLPGQATDVTLAPYSAFDANNPAAPPGNAQVVYASLVGQGAGLGASEPGIYVSTSEGNTGTWTQMTGAQGGSPLLRTPSGQTISAQVPFNQPSNPFASRVVLAAPALTGQLIPGQAYTGNRARDLIYQGWLYAAEVSGTGSNTQFLGLYVTKDRGQNWTAIQLPVANGFPTDDETAAAFNPASNTGFSDLALAVDPNNPNVVYLAGNGSPLRVDTTGVEDPYAVVSYDDSDKDGGQMQPTSTGAAQPGYAGLQLKDPTTGKTFVVPYLNAQRDPNNVFLNNATLVASGVQPATSGIGFSNNGTNIHWSVLPVSIGRTRRLLTERDPLTGATRLVVGTANGVWTALNAADGSVPTALGVVPGVGDAGTSIQSGLVGGDRNGNLQLFQANAGAVQPSALAAQIGQALFYANSFGNGSYPVSDPNELTDGNLTWEGARGDGGGIATDQTGSGSVYTYQTPLNNGRSQSTDFFAVDPNGTFIPSELDAQGNFVPFPSRTTGLVEQNLPGPVPDPGWSGSQPYGDATSNLFKNQVFNSNPAVNPINGDDLLISSNDGRIFRSGDQGVTWSAVAFGPNDPLGREFTQPQDVLDGAYANALAFGPVDPMDPSARPDLNFLFVGSTAGHAYVTVNGGGSWTDVSSGLDGSPVMAVSANPKPGSHEFYAVTEKGVYHLTFTVTWVNGVVSINGTPNWTNVTGDLFTLTHNDFNDPNFSEPYLEDPTGNAKPDLQGGGLTSLAVDWRYVIPDNPLLPKGSTHPLLYVGGEGGVFRSGDVLNPGGTTNWTIFPNNLPVTAVGPDGLPGDGAPVAGGYLPIAHVTSLELSVGNINPASGLPDQPTGPNLLYATTAGLGTFAIRLPLSSVYNTVLGPSVSSAVAINPSNGVLPNPVNQNVGLDTVNVVFSGTIDPSTFTVNDVQLTGPAVASISRSGNTATVVMQQPDGFKVGDRINIAGATPAAYNGSFTITSILSPTTFTITVTGNPGPATGNITVLRALEVPVVSISSSGTTATATTSAPHGYNVGDRVVIAGASATGYDGTFTILSVPTPTTFTYAVVPGLPAVSDPGMTADELPVRQLVNLTGLTSAFAVTSISRSGTTATVTTSGPNGFVSGDQVTISGANIAGYNGTFTIVSTGLNTFTYTVPSTLNANPGGTITATKVSGPTANNLWQVELVHQLSYGNYTLTVGPAITDYAGHPMDQDHDDNGGGGNPDDAFTQTFTIAGLQVVGVVSPANPVPTPPGLTAVVVNFNAPVDPASFNVTRAGIVSLVGPKGPVTIASAQDVSGNAAIAALLPAGQADHAWQLNLQTAQLAPGTYTLTIGPNLSDTGDAMGGSEQLMDQNENAFPGEAGVAPGGDQFQTTFTIGELKVVSVTPSLQATNSAVPALSSATITFNREVLPSSFDVTDLTLTGPNGTTIPVTNLKDLTQGNTNRHDIWEADFANQTTAGVYTLVVGPNITDSTGAKMDQDGDATTGGTGAANDAYTAQFDIAGLAVTSLTPSGPVPVPIRQGSVTVTFNQAVLAASLNSGTVTLTDPQNNPVAPTKFVHLAADPLNPTQDRWEIDFAPQTVYGTYTLTVTTGVEDLAGEPMNQNGNAMFGENPADAFTGTFVIGGLHIVSVTPSTTNPVLAPPGLGAMTVTFNMPLDNTTFTTADVQLTGPDGSSIPFALADVTPANAPAHTVWQVTPLDASNSPTFESTPGVYTLVVGPAINDLGGNAMDQNLNGNHGEPFVNVGIPGDAFVAQFNVNGLQVIPPVLPAGTPVAVQTLVSSNGVATATTAGANGFVNGDLVTITGANEAGYDGTFTITNVSGNSFSYVVPLATPATATGSVTAALQALAPGQSSVTVTFNQAVQAASMNGANITLTGPGALGSIPVTAKDLTLGTTNTHNVWEIDFAPETQPGTYTLTVGPGVKDVAGNPMNQNGNNRFGEAFINPAQPGDAFQSTFTIDGLRVASISPDPTQPFLDNPAAGNPMTLGAVSITFNREVNLNTFGTADVTLTGPGGKIPVLLSDVTPAGATFAHSVWKIFFNPQSQAGVYTLTVGPHISDGDPTSAEMDQNMNQAYGEPGVAPAGDVFLATYDVDGLRVVPPVLPQSPLPLPVGLSSVTVTFNQAVDATTFNANNVTLTGPRGNVQLLSFTDLTLGTTMTHTQWKVTFLSSLTAYGTYTLNIAPGVKDLAGNPMNQNANEVYGEADDGFQSSFQIGGLMVIASQVTPPTNQPVLTPSGLSTITLPFNMEVQPNTFTTADITLRRPDGSTVSQIMLTDKTVGNTNLHNLWELDFAPQTTPGVYKLTVGPTIDDIGSHLMDQNQNGVFGDPGDAFVAQFSVDGLAVVSATPPTAPVAVTSITSAASPGSGAVATASTGSTAHGFNPGDQVLIQGANEAGYDGTVTVLTVPDPFTFTYAVPANTPPSATGTLSATERTQAGLSQDTITFNQGVLPGSLNANTVTLTGPAGKVSPLTFADATTGSPNLHNVWTVGFAPLTTPGVYTLTVGPGVEDLAGNQMNQNHNMAFGDAGVAPGGDAYQTTFVIDGLHVTSVTPLLAAPVPDNPGLSSVTVTFNRPVNPATFDATDLKLLTPAGTTVAGLTLNDISSTVPFSLPSTVWNITFPQQTTAGVYTLTVGPHISDQDPLNREMDQNENQQYGEASDAFVAQFDVDGLQVVSTTPAANAVLPAGTSALDVQFNQAVLGSTLNAANVTLAATFPVKTITSSGTLARVTTVSPHGFVTGQSVTIAGAAQAGYNGTFTVAVTGPNTFTYTLPSAQPSPAGGTITVAPTTTIPLTGFRDLTLGTTKAHDLWEVDFAPQTIYGTYTLTVGPGVEDLAGNPMNQNNNTVYGEAGLTPFGDAYQATYTITGLQVKSVTPVSSTPVLGTQGLSSATVTFNMGVDSTTFDPGDVTLTRPDGTTVPVTTVADISSTVAGAAAASVWKVTFPTQSTSGVYALTVGPQIDDLGGNLMDQNLNGTGGETPGDQFTALLDVNGLAVASVTPSGPTPLLPGVGAVTVSFNQAVLASTMVPGNFTLTGPLGPIPVTGFVHLPADPANPTQDRWEVDFPSQTAPGTFQTPGLYTLTVGTGVEDLAGNPMNQNGNTTPGESGLAPAGDQAQSTFTIDGLRVVSVTPNPGNPIIGPGGLSSVMVTFNREVDPNTFTVADLTVTKPDGSLITPTNGGLTLRDLGNAPGGLPDSLWQVTFAAQTAPGVYTLKVGPHISDRDPTAAEMDQNQNQKYGEATDAFTGKFDVGGLQVLSVVPGASAPAGLSSITVTFNQAVLKGSLGANTVSIVGPNGPVSGLGFSVTNNLPNVVVVTFNPLNTYGTYTVTVGPGVQDLAGNAMNQNGNALFGETGVTPAGDAYSSTFRIDGLRVVSAAPATVVSSLSSVVLTFNMGVNPSTFTASSVVLIGPNGAGIPVTVTDLTSGPATLANPHNVWEIDFAPQTGQGTYTLTVLPNLLDANGHLMDQNGNGQYGEVPADEFSAPFVVGAPSVPVVTPTGPSTPTTVTGLDISGLVQFTAGKVGKRRGKFQRQTVQIFNTSNLKISGPFFLIVGGLPRNVHLFSASGFTSSAHGPAGLPYQMIPFTANQLNSLQGGTFTLIYSNPKGRKFHPSFRLLAGVSNP
jgi:subtilisin-like proprotein convertase family protein